MQKASLVKVLGLILGSAIAVATIFPQSGCLTPKQQAAMAEYSSALESSETTLIGLKEEALKYRAEFDAIVTKIKTGEVPYAEGMQLASKVMGNYNVVLAKITEVSVSISKTKDSIKTMKDEETPWWGYAIASLPAILGGISIFLPQLSPFAAAAMAAKNSLVKKDEMAVSLSRTLDALVVEEPGLKILKQDLMNKEMALDEAAIKADYDALRASAKLEAV